MPQSPESVLRDALEDLTEQFAYSGLTAEGRLALTTGGLSALEGAFAALGWEDPHPVPERECQEPGCHAEATCGLPTAGGYRRLCTKCADAAERR